MNDAVRDCLVTGFESITETLDLPDKDDRHVLAAAIRCDAQAIVTANLRDFPHHVLSAWGVEAIAPDEFVLDLIDLDLKVVWACVQQIADSRVNPPQDVDEVLSQLERSGLIEAASALRVR
jgi:hypothetical protein